MLGLELTAKASVGSLLSWTKILRGTIYKVAFQLQINSLSLDLLYSPISEEDTQRQPLTR